MDTKRLKRVDAYNDVIGIDKLTARRSSEAFYDCPPQDVVASGVRDIRGALNDIYRDDLFDEEHAIPQGFTYDEVLDQYWDMARRTPIEFSGTPTSMDEYFEVLSFRQEQQVRANLRERYSQGSLPIIMLDTIELYARELGTSVAASVRISNILLQGQFPALKERASELRRSGELSEIEATIEAFREFSEVTVPGHIEQIRDALGADFPLVNDIKKVPFPPRPQASDSEPLYIKADEVEGFVRVYDLERRPITLDEMAMAKELIKSRQLRTSFLLFHMAVVDYTTQYFTRNPDHLQHNLMSYNLYFTTERNGDDVEVLPNPSLIAILSNNVTPAIAAVMLREGATVDNLSADFVAKGINEVKTQHLFQTHIGKFNNLNPQTDTVELDGFFNLICPGTRVVMTGLTNWLPKIYDSCSDS